MTPFITFFTCVVLLILLTAVVLKLLDFVYKCFVFYVVLFLCFIINVYNGTFSKNLQSILCQNKQKLLPSSHPGVYHLDCTCNSRYTGESKKKVLTCCIELQQDSIRGFWQSSSTTEHTKMCHGQFNGRHLRTVTIMPNMYKRKLHGALEINRLKTVNETDKMFQIQNRDKGDYVTTNNWKPLFQKIGNL